MHDKFLTFSISKPLLLKVHINSFVFYCQMNEWRIFYLTIEVFSLSLFLMSLCMIGDEKLILGFSISGKKSLMIYVKLDKVKKNVPLVQGFLLIYLSL